MKSFLKWFAIIIGGLAVIILIIYTISWFSFDSWRQQALDALPGNSSIAQTNRGPIEYIIEGDASRYVLLLHGTPGSYRTFAIQPFLDNNYSVLSPSRPGYFRTPLEVGKTPKQQADAFAALLDTLHIDSVMVVAYSGGGPSALQFALLHPDKCYQLVLISVVSQKLEFDPAMHYLFSREYGTWFALNMLLSQAEDEEFVPKAEKYVQSDVFPPSQIIPGLENDIYQFGRITGYPLENITVPTLIFHGTEDKLIPFSEAEDMASRIPGAVLVKEVGKDHFPVVFFGVESVYARVVDLLNK